MVNRTSHSPDQLMAHVSYQSAQAVADSAQSWVMVGSLWWTDATAESFSLIFSLHLSHLAFMSPTVAFGLSTAFTRAQMWLTSDLVTVRSLCWGHFRCSRVSTGESAVQERSQHFFGFFLTAFRFASTVRMLVRLFYAPTERGVFIM